MFQSNCVQECKLQGAVAKCGCVPWHKPRPNGDSLPVCHKAGSLCVEQIVNRPSRELTESCNEECPFDCSTVSYNYYLYVDDMDDDACDFFGEPQDVGIPKYA